MTLNGNPSLRRVVRGSENGKYTAIDDKTASMGSMVWKTIAFCLVTVVAAVLSAVLLNHFLITENADALAKLVIVLVASAIPLFIITIVIMFAPKTAGVLGFVYCILEGLVMGAISALCDIVIPGIAIMALLGTCFVLLVSCVAFNLLGRRLSNKFIMFVFISFISLILLEAVGYILSLFVPLFAVMMNNFWVQLAISAIMILWASFMILIDLNNMKRLADSNADKKYEWLAAFSLVTTLMWLYVEILELLARIVLAAKRN